MRTILIKVDNDCEMAEVCLDGECIMEGNFWDFHPNCTGVHEYGDFGGYADLSRAIYQHLIKVEKEAPENIKTIRENYTYE